MAQRRGAIFRITLNQQQRTHIEILVGTFRRMQSKPSQDQDQNRQTGDIRRSKRLFAASLWKWSTSRQHITRICNKKTKTNNSIAQYYRELKQLSIEAVPKDTEKNRKHHLRNTLVLGLRDESIRRALISFSNDANKTNEAVSLEDAKIESTSVENNKKSIAIINNIEQQCNSDSDYDANSECQVNYANTNYRKTRFSTTVQNGTADKSQTKTSQYIKQPMEPSTVRVTTGTNQYHLSQQQAHPQEHHMLPQQLPIQQTMPHSYHQYHQAKNQNQQQWNGYPQNRVKPCYACFQFGHRE